MTNPADPTFIGSRRKAALGFALCLGAVTLGYWFTTLSSTVRRSAEFYDILGWSLVFLFGGFGLAWAASLVVPHRLWITQEGFAVKRAWSGIKQYKWIDIDEIWVRYDRGSSSVVWSTTRPSGTITRAFFGIDDWLPGAWKISAEELAGELRSAQDRYRLKCLSGAGS